jgi:hypothetical protein
LSSQLVHNRMEEAGLVALAGITLMLVLHQAAQRGEHQVLVLGQHHTSLPSRHAGTSTSRPCRRPSARRAPALLPACRPLRPRW